MRSLDWDTRPANFIREIDRAFHSGRLVDKFLAQPEVQGDLRLIREELATRPERQSWRWENLPNWVVEAISTSLARHVSNLPTYEDVFPSAKLIVDVAGSVLHFRNISAGAGLLQDYIDLLVAHAIFLRTKEVMGS